jgi:hypothetical protein
MALDAASAWTAPLIMASRFEDATGIDLMELQELLGDVQTLTLAGKLFVRPRQIARLIEDNIIDAPSATVEMM